MCIAYLRLARNIGLCIFVLKLYCRIISVVLFICVIHFHFALLLLDMMLSFIILQLLYCIFG